MVDLNVDEAPGGYGDRTGAKNEKYIMWLEKDLLEYPDDPRTLYYLGYAHFDIFLANKESPQPMHRANLTKGVQYFKRRVGLTKGNKEEKWFATLKLGEIYERFYNDWSIAKSYYTQATEQDAERADGWFYLGQHYRLRGEYDVSFPYLLKAAQLNMPQRSLFQWHHLYSCLSKLELGRCVSANLNGVSRKNLKDTKRLLALAMQGYDSHERGEVSRIHSTVADHLKATKKEKSRQQLQQQEQPDQQQPDQ